MKYEIYCPWCGNSITRYVDIDKFLDIGHCECDGMTSLEWSENGLDIRSCMGHEKHAKLSVKEAPDARLKRTLQPHERGDSGDN